MSMGSEFVDLLLPQGSVKIEYQWLNADAGDRPLMIFLHEGLGSLSMWRDFPALLCAALDCRGLVYSRPGYGLSTPRQAAQAWTPDFMHRQADQLLPALCRAMQLEQPVWLFGHSDGASIGLLYAAMFPAQVAGAILLAPHCFVEDITIANIAAARTAYLHTDLRQRLSKYHADPDSAFWGWNDIWLNPGFRSWCIDDHLASLACPLLLVQGSDDEYGTLEQVQRIARQVRQCELLELADCGHSPHRDQKDRLIEAAVSFFQRQGDKP